MWKNDRVIDTAKASGLGAALVKLQAGLSKPRSGQGVATIMQRLGRAKQRFARAAQHYEITVSTDFVDGNLAFEVERVATPEQVAGQS